MVTIMARVIEYYIPEKVQRTVRWIPPNRRGKIIKFPVPEKSQREMVPQVSVRLSVTGNSTQIASKILLCVLFASVVLILSSSRALPKPAVLQLLVKEESFGQTELVAAIALHQDGKS